MAQTKFICVGLGEDDTHNFVLYAGMEVKELVGLFESAFWDTLSTIPSQNIWILGLENCSSGGTTSLEAVCKDPSFLSSRVMYRLMLSGTPPRASLPTPPAQIEDTLSADLSRAREEMFRSRLQPAGVDVQKQMTHRTSSGEEDDDGYSDSDDSEEPIGQNEGSTSPLSPHSDEAVVTALSSFVGECEGASLFTADEARALLSLLQGEPAKECDAVVRAAYLVCYANGRDAQLLYAVLKDVAGKQLSAEGREEHIAQEELVEMVESLTEEASVSQREAVFLLELIVRKAQPIVKIYQNYAHHCDYARIKMDIANMAKDMLQDERLTPTPPPRPPPPPSPPAPMKKKDSVMSEGWEVDSMDTVDSDDEMMTRGKQHQNPSCLPTTRSGLAAALSANARPFVPGSSGEFDEASSVLEAVVTRAHLEGALSPGDAEVATQLIKSRNTLLFNAQARFADEPVGLRELVLAVVRAERARRQAVENAHASHDEPSWASLPKPLLNLLQVAESQGLVQHDDAILVCNAFIHNFELVHAGWEVYEDEGDEAELLDTILRVVRSGRLHQQMALYEEGGSDPYEDEGGKADDEEDEYEAGKRAGEEKNDRLPEVAISVLRTVAGRLEASGALTGQESDALIELAEEGDPALHACFEVYAEDNDLEELLSSLQSLAHKVGSSNKSPSSREDDDSPEEVSSGGDDVAENEDSDQEEEEAEDSASWRVMAAELFDLLRCLQEDGKLSASEVSVLGSLIERREPRVLAAYDAYVMFRDVEDLIDTLERIARLALQGSIDLPETSSKQETNEMDPGFMSKLFPYTSSVRSDEAVTGSQVNDDEDSSNSSSSVGENEDETMELGNEERKAMLLMLLERGALSHEEVIVLMRKMLVHDDRLVAYAFEEFQEHQSFDTFLKSLKQLADPNASQFTIDDSSSSDSESSHDSELNRDSVIDDSKQQDDDYSDDEDYDASDALEDETEAELGRVFMSVVREMDLSEAESMALRLCIARDDPHVRAALEVFKLERDEDDLRDTLKRLSRRTVEAMMREIESNES